MPRLCRDPRETSEAYSNAACDSGETIIASLVYNGNGQRVKSVINGETILFIGAIMK